MSPISSNTLLHFTDTRQNLVSILRDEFRPHYSLEDFSILRNKPPGAPGLTVAFPMVCFCDIPLSQAKEHMRVYGRYALGLRKEWGMSHYLTPVLYAHADTPTTRRLPDLLATALTAGESRDVILAHAARLLFLSKPYRGPFWRRGQLLDDVVFYNEREWRFIPADDTAFRVLTKEGFDDPAIRREADAAVSHFQLTFTPSDIKYVIVESEDEILPMIRDLESIKGPNYLEDDVKLLSSRMISAQQVSEDF